MEALATIQPLISLVISAATLVGIVLAVYKFSSDPDKENQESIKVLQTGCKIKHDNIDIVIGGINKQISIIKENHLTHIERDINEMKNTQTRILTILEEREK